MENQNINIEQQKKEAHKRAVKKYQDKHKNIMSRNWKKYYLNNMFIMKKKYNELYYKKTYFNENGTINDKAHEKRGPLIIGLTDYFDYGNIAL
jgi:hypothetical protein